MSIASTPLLAEVDNQLLEAIRDVGHQGAGHTKARAAVLKLSQLSAEELPEILTAMNDANPLAVNWLRAIFETVAARGLKEQGELPIAGLREFFDNKTNDHRARRLAYEWMVQAEPALADKIIPISLDDPSPEMRRDAVTQLTNLATTKGQSQEEVIALYRKALTGATDADQVDRIIKALEKLDQKVDPVAHYGLVTAWKVIGPFDNVDMKGFDVAYPPEEKVDFAAVCSGQKGEVKWELFTSEESEGKFDIAELTEPHKGAIDYVATEFASDTDQDVEFRLSTANAWKMWVNGELLFAREEYHRGMRFDQYRVRGKLKKGNNLILIKVCQNEQEDSWAQDWSFKFRICDLTGRAIRPTESAE